jgi:hypothetical protein
VDGSKLDLGSIHPSTYVAANEIVDSVMGRCTHQLEQEQEQRERKPRRTEQREFGIACLR